MKFLVTRTTTEVVEVEAADAESARFRAFSGYLSTDALPVAYGSSVTAESNDS